MDNLRDITPSLSELKTGTRALKDSAGNYILTGIGGDFIPGGAGNATFYKCASVTLAGSTVVVADAGTSACNGTYTLTSGSGSSRVWVYGDIQIYWDGEAKWVIQDQDEEFPYYTAEDTTGEGDPWDMEWMSSAGASPEPTVTEGSATTASWTGYKLTIAATGITYASTSTSGLTYSATVPVVNGIYNDGVTQRIYEETLIAGNIKKDVGILGVTGTYEGSGTTTFYKCASVDTTAKTWTGYEATYYDLGWHFAEEATSGLTFDDDTPTVGQIYDRNVRTQSISPYESGLKFTALQDSSTIKINQNGSPNVAGLQYRTTGDWATYTCGTTISLDSGEVVWFRNTQNTLSNSSSNYAQFVMTGSIRVDGNIMTMVNYSSITAYCFYKLFFQCTVLATVPDMPATTMAESCYYSMYSYCDAITSIPEDLLPATTLATNCYRAMFSHCDGLTTTCQLPATTMAATCYASMWYDCQGLTSAKEISATTLADGCFTSMFNSDANLAEVHVKFTSWPSGGFNVWMNGVKSSGNFYKPAALSVLTGENYIPSGWTAVDE